MVILLLASRSEARRAMLVAAGVPFEPVDADFDETAAKADFRALDAAELAGALAEAKARSVAADAGDLVLGSDQTLERDDGTRLGKPASREEAFAQLRSLSGRTHRLHSAAAIVEQGRPVWRNTESVALTMRPLSDRFLESYLDGEYEAIRWSVGGYRIEGPGVQLFDRIEGSHFAILGLPLLPLLGYLRERGVIPG
jgi:septum formation protein